MPGAVEVAELEPGDLQRLPGGRWRCRTPAGEVVSLCSIRYSVRQEQGGLTVEPAIRTTDWTWRLRGGRWTGQ